MLKHETTEVIKDAVEQNRLSFFELDDNERRVVVAHLLHTSDQGLIDADHHQHIQHAVANLIVNKANAESIAQLVKAIDIAFLTGDTEHEPHYADDIQTLLSDAWDDERRQPNEHYEHDLIQRTRDIQEEQRRMKGIF